MDTDGSGDSGFEDRGGSLLDCPSSGIFAPLLTENVLGLAMSAEPLCESWNGVNSYFSVGWDRLNSVAQNVEIKAPPMASLDQIDSSSYTAGILENQGTISTSHLVQYPSNPSIVGLVPNLPRFGSGSFSEMDSSSILPKCHQVVDSIRSLDYTLEGIATQKTLTSRNGADNCAQFCEERQNSDEGTMKPFSNGKKRKRVSNDQPQIAQLMNVESEQQKDEYPEEQDEGKHKTELNPVANMHSKLVGKEVEDYSHNGEAPKEDYVHVRAKRGQATNSHSLAERVRREKISERMKFLQDLVPGCNKITGKAVMLDEIINYVQSLQRQVEFLSMKLATVYPEMNVDIERILSKDIHHSQGGTAAILGFDPVMSSSYPIPQVTLQGALPVIQGSNLQSTPMPRLPSVWNDELQSISQMGFISNAALDILEPNG